MPTTIKLKNSVTTTNAPSSLVQGEVAINITDKKVWVGNAATTPIQLLGDGGSVNFTTVDTTNLQVTNIKAKDGTASATIANSTGVFTHSTVTVFPAGTVSAPAITTTGDTNTGIFFPAADTIAFTEGGVEAMRIDSSGNVGIGTSSPAVKLEVNGTGELLRLDGSANQNRQIYLRNVGTGTARVFTDGTMTVGSNSAYPVTFITNDTERMRITSGGDLLVGTTNNPAKITTNGNMYINAGGYNSALGTGLTINAGGYNDTTSKARVVHIGGVGDNNNRCGWTAYSIKTNTVNNGAEYYIRPVIWNGSAFTEQGSAGVYLTDNATSWTSASDERLKENLEPIANAVEKIKTIRAVTGKYKADTDGTSRAFLIAQDVQAVLPEAVTENSEGYLGLAYTETIPLLVAAMKEQQAMIEELKAEVALLKSK